MNELNQKLREALGTEGAELLGPLDEPTLWQQVIETFQGRKRWLQVLAVVGILAFFIFSVVSAVCFFQAESVREMLAWAGGFGLGLIAVTSGRLWFWMDMHKNAVVREVKRVQLQIARLSSQLRKPM